MLNQLTGSRIFLRSDTTSMPEQPASAARTSGFGRGPSSWPPNDSSASSTSVVAVDIGDERHIAFPGA